MRLVWIMLAVGCGSDGGTLSSTACTHTQGTSTTCCRSEADCANATSCAPDGTPPGMGACPTANCTTDAECRTMGGHDICEPLACNGGSWCVEGCTSDLFCAEGQMCNTTTNRCGPKACTTATDCPSNFSCTASTCARLSCASDSDCSGYCVLGACYANAGECRAPVP